MVWQLWLCDKLPLADFDKVSIDDVDLGIRALEAWHEDS